MSIQLVLARNSRRTALARLLKASTGMNLDSTVRVLQWCFMRGAHLITCAIELRQRDRAYEVLTIPHWDPLGSSTEHFAGPAAALQRHAAIARELRDHGWQLAAYTP